jgi:structural maintenance of chromosome 2
MVQERDALKAQLSALDFAYTPPSPSFDPQKVKGLVASLVALAPGDYDKATALEVTAGAKMYNVVVEDERVGKELLVGGKLKKRVTVIPLNKISAFRMSAKVCVSPSVLLMLLKLNNVCPRN